MARRSLEKKRPISMADVAREAVSRSRRSLEWANDYQMLTKIRVRVQAWQSLDFVQTLPVVPQKRTV